MQCYNINESILLLDSTRNISSALLFIFLCLCVRVLALMLVHVFELMRVLVLALALALILMRCVWSTMSLRFQYKYYIYNTWDEVPSDYALPSFRSFLFRRASS